MHMSLEEVLWPNIRILSIIGIWPLPSNSTTASKLFAYFRIFIHFMCSFILILSMLYTIRANWGDLSTLADLGYFIFLHLLIIFKLIYVILRREACHRIYHQLEIFWQISNDTQERQNFEYFTVMAKIITVTCFAVAFSDIQLFIIPSIISDFTYRLADNSTNIRRVLPLDILYGFDYQHSAVFECLLVFQIITLICGVTTIIGNDCTAMTVVLHVSGQFRLMSARLRAIGREISYDKFHDLNDELVFIEIGRCIEHHKKIIRIADELNGLLGPMACVHILIASLIICLGGFSVIKGNNSKAEIVKFTILVISVIVQLLLWCWPGELLIQESTAIARTIFLEMPWFMLPTKIKRDLSLVILRSQKESTIDCFLQVMCIRKVTEVINTAGSYMALLRSIQE